MNLQGCNYAKLPGRGRLGLARLWLGDDHLLEVSWMIFAERYRRFPLADIRAFAIEPTRARLIWTWVNGVIALLGSAAAASVVLITIKMTAQDRVAIVALWVLASVIGAVSLVFWIACVVNVALGPSCRCSLQTGAGMRTLAAPSRRRGAERLLQRLAPQIEAAQSAPKSA